MMCCLIDSWRRGFFPGAPGKSSSPASWLLVLALFATTANGLSASIFPTGTNWRIFEGGSEASSPDPTAWRQPDFDDFAFIDAFAPFWYGDTLPGGTELVNMRGNYTTLFLRKEFFLINATNVSELQLDALSDDGFVAWINGKEIVRFNVPAGELPYTASASPALPEPLLFETWQISNPAGLLLEGRNVIAVQALNASLSNSSDFSIDVSLSDTIDDVRPTMTAIIPAADTLVRTLAQIEIHFSEPVTNVDAADLLINGVPATNLTVFGADQYVFAFDPPPTGTVYVAWSWDHGITDLAPAPNPFDGGNWTYEFNPLAPVPGVMISELMADNGIGYHDEDGDSSDWIEIFNSSDTTVSLDGWFLTGTTNNLAKWRFPNVSIGPGSYLVVFASGKNRTNALSPLHTNFKLGAAGEYLALVNAKTNVVSEFRPTYPPQRDPKVSYGRDLSNPETLGYFPKPTPGTPNLPGGPGFAPEVTFSQAGGTFYNTFSLSLSTPDTNAVIYFTLDGSPPSDFSQLYTNPIIVFATTEVRARAYVPGPLPGPSRSEAYLQLSPNVLNFVSDLPIVVIHNFAGGTVPADIDQPAYLEIFEPVNGKTSLTNAPVLRSRAGLSIRGSSTVNYPKKSFKVEWWNEFDEGKDLSVLGMPAESDWVMYAPNNFDAVLIHNPFIYELSNDIGRYAPRTRFAEVYVNTAGGRISSANYNGIYVFEEKIKRDKNRVDVDKLEPENLTAPTVTGGYVLKIDRPDPGDTGFGAAGQTIIYVDPKETEIELPQRDPQEQYIRNYFNSFGSVLNGANYANPTTGYAAYVDLDAWIDHHVLNTVAFNVDALRLSAYFYKPRNGKINFGPIWDFDRALGSTDGRDANPRVWAASGGTDFFTYTWWGRMFTDPNFWQKWIDRYQDLRRTHFATTNINAKIDAKVALVRQAQPREYAKWGNIAPVRGSYANEVVLMKNWMANRLNFIDTNLLSAPIFSSNGQQFTNSFSLSLAGPPGATIYYTVNNTDPRLSGGGVSPQALVYTGPILLTNISFVIARSYNATHRNLTGGLNPPISSPWSGTTRARFFVNPAAAFGDLAVTEINYHPSPPTAAELAVNPLFTDDDFEFVELKNISARTVDLYGARFTRGIDFSFTTSSIVTLTPSDYLLLIRSPAAFSVRYGSRTNIAGVYAGTLDNNGGHLRLAGALDRTIFDFEYNDAWYPLSDGLGFTLVARDESITNQSDTLSWRSSSERNGSPGRVNLAPLPFAPIRVNEALTHTDPPALDSIELFNPAATNVNIGNWFLTDDRRTPTKYRIPTNTWVSGGGYVVFDENDFNANPQATNNFSLNSFLGDDVYLFSADAQQNLTGYAHGFDFGASQNGVSFGFYQTSVGAAHFVAQSSVSLRATNSGPRVGPAVINEIMYAPPRIGTNNNTRDEFVELRNITSSALALFDPAAATNTWHLGGGIVFEFPTNVVMAPGEMLLVTGFDPATNAQTTAAFRASYGIASAVRIFGAFSGNLNNAGDRIRLFKPDPPQATNSSLPGFVPYVLVDQVDYSSLPPWPVDGLETGLTLQRLVGSAYGNDPTNWLAAAPTAGAANITNPADIDADGLPNDWELAYGLDPRTALGNQGSMGDPDGDGLTNWQEFLSGTNPLDAGDYLHLIFVTGGAGPTKLRFTAAANRSYTVQYRDDLNAATQWQTLAQVSPANSTRQVEIDDPNPAPSARFYRVVTPGLL